MEENFYKITKTLGTLKQQKVDGAKITELPFVGKLVTEDTWFDYGTRYLKKLELFTLGNPDDIVIGDYTFSRIIEVNASYIHTYRSYDYTFCIEYLDSDGCKHGFNADNRTSSELIDTVYAIILIATLKNLDSIKSLWNIRNIDTSDVNAALKRLNEAKDNAEKAIAEYPVIRQFLKDEIKIAENKLRRECKLE